ncbi:MAG: hypothetical protein ACR2P3_03615 [Geminicoccaceae bacterium]
MKRYLHLGVVLLLAGCGSTEKQQAEPPSPPPEVEYATPITTPARTVPFTVKGNVPDLVDRVVRALGQSGFAVDHVDRNAGIVTAKFQSDPESYIDCGTLLMTADGSQAVTMSAATDRLRYDISLDQGTRVGTIDRIMVLDGRAIVRIKRSGFNVASVSTSGDYVLTRMAVLRTAGSEGAKRRKQYLAFGTGQAVHFDEGSTICQSNGRLERDVLRPEDLAS